MVYYLYVKTHNHTGLKYLGQTRQHNFHKYKGSGIYWCDHLKKHGYDITTEIIGTYQTREQLKEAGIYYSQLWNIVESDEWANLQIEKGDGGVGYISKEHYQRLSVNLKGKLKSELTKKQFSISAKQRAKKEQRHGKT